MSPRLREGFTRLSHIIAGNPEYTSLESRFLHLSLFYIFSFCIFAFFQNSFLELDKKLNYLLIAMLLSISFIYYLSRVKNYFNLATWLATITGSGAISIAWFYNNGIYGPTTFIWVAVFGILSFIGNRKTKSATLVLFISIITFLFINNYFNPSYSNSYTNRTTHFLDMYFSLITVSITLFFTYNFAIKNYKKAKIEAVDNFKKIQNINEQIKEQNIKQKELLKQISRNESALRYHQEQQEIIGKVLKHDLINNLTAIHSTIKIHQSNKDEKYLDEALKLVQKSAELIRNIREQEQLIKDDATRVLYLLSDILSNIQMHHPNIILKNIQDCTVIADKGIFSILDNIINNAIIHGKTDRIEISNEIINEHMLLRICDYGIGIPNEIKENVFEEGFRHGSTGNTGLGLFLVKKILERMGGSISLEDTYPHGATFIIRLNIENSAITSKRNDSLNHCLN